MNRWLTSCVAGLFLAASAAAAMAQERPPGAGPGGPGGPGRRPAPAFGSTAQPKDDAEKKILDVLADLDKTQRRGNMNVPTDDGRLLRMLAESVNAQHVVEIGTSNGYSGIWFCLALRTTGGKLTTFEIDEERIKLAKANFVRAGVEKLVTIVEGDAHKNVEQVKEPIDLLFLDADKEGYLDYLRKLLPQVKSGGLIVAHNMSRGMADPKFVEAITTDSKLDTIFISVSGAQGISITVKKR